MIKSLEDLINLKVCVHPYMPDDIIALRETRTHSTKNNYKFMFIHLSDFIVDGAIVEHPTEVIASPLICQKILKLRKRSLE